MCRVRAGLGTEINRAAKINIKTRPYDGLPLFKADRVGFLMLRVQHQRQRLEVL